jgi:hypothetical protein
MGSGAPNSGIWHVPGCAYLRRRQGRGRTARSVERDDVLAARRFHQREAIAADPGHRGLAQPQKNASRDRGIHRVAARLQHVDRHFRRQGCDVAHIPFSAKTADRPG